MTAPGREIYGPHAMKLSWPTRLILGLLAVAGIASAGFGLADRLSDRASARTDKLNGCRSTLSTELVSAPQAIVLKRLADFGFDSAEFRQAATKLQPERYQKLTRLALADPDAFLAECDRVVSATDGKKVTPYQSCAAADAAGVTPLRASDAGYNPELDRDGDGLACEN